MSKLNINASGGKFISFIALSEDDALIESGIAIVGNSDISISGTNPINLSFNSKNSVLGKNKNSYIFEFANNDYVDVANANIVEKNINESNNVVSILNKGIRNDNNCESIIELNSINDEVVNSEKVTLINSNNTQIEDSTNIFNFGDKNNIVKSNECITIGKNIRLNTSKRGIVIGFNVNSNKSNQVLIGNFDDIYVSDFNIALANKKNYMYFNNYDEKFHIGKKLIFNRSLYNDKIEEIPSSYNIVLSNKIKTDQPDSYNNNVILGDSHKITNVTHNVIAGVESVVNGGDNDIVGGTKNEYSNTSNSIIFGSNNTCDLSVNDTIIGIKNKETFGNHNLIFGSNNNMELTYYSIIEGSYNTIKEIRHSIISGENHNIYKFSGSIIIGEYFYNNKTKSPNLNYSYVISNTKTSLVFNSDYISIDKYSSVTYKDYFSNCKEFTSYYDFFRYSLISNDKRTYITSKGNEVFGILGKNGYCNLYGISVNLQSCVFKIYNPIGSNVLRYKMYSERFDKITSLPLYLYYYTEGSGDDIKYYFHAMFGNTNACLFVEKSSKFELLTSDDFDKTKSLTGASFAGESMYSPEIKSFKDLNCSVLYMNNFKSQKEWTIDEVHINILNNDITYNINNKYFDNVENKVLTYNQFMAFVKLGEYISLSEPSVRWRQEQTYYAEYYKIYGNAIQVRPTEYEYTIFSDSFYTSRLVLNYVLLCQGHINYVGHSTPIPLIDFSKDGVLYPYFDLQKRAFFNFILDYKRNGDNYTLKVFTLDKFEKNDIKDLFSKLYTSEIGDSGLTRDGDFSKIDNVTQPNINSIYLSGNKSAWDNIIRFRDEKNAKGVDFISNTNTTYITKWGLFANVNFHTLSRIEGSDNSSDLSNFTYKYMHTTMCCNDVNIEYAQFNNKEYNVVNGSGIEGDKLSEYYSDSMTIKTYTQNIFDNQTDNVYNDVYIPFVNVGSSRMYQFASYKKGFMPLGSYGYDLYNSLAPKSKIFAVIKRLQCFSYPLSLVIRHNDRYDRFSIYNDSLSGRRETKHYPLFVGSLNFNNSNYEETTTNVEYIDTNNYFSDLATKMYGLRRKDKNTFNTDSFRYINEMFKNNATFINKKEENFARVSFTYALKSIASMYT